MAPLLRYCNRCNVRPTEFTCNFSKIRLHSKKQLLGNAFKTRSTKNEFALRNLKYIYLVRYLGAAIQTTRSANLLLTVTIKHVSNNLFNPKNLLLTVQSILP